MPGIASADPEPAPATPNVNAYTPAKPSDFAQMGGAWYAFGAPGGLTCVMDRQTGAYGCHGPIPAAPNGANVVSGGTSGAPGFATSDHPHDWRRQAVAAEYAADLPNGELRDRRRRDDVRELLRQLRLRDQPAGSFILEG